MELVEVVAKLKRLRYVIDDFQKSGRMNLVKTGDMERISRRAEEAEMAVSRFHGPSYCGNGRGNPFSSPFQSHGALPRCNVCTLSTVCRKAMIDFLEWNMTISL